MFYAADSVLPSFRITEDDKARFRIRPAGPYEKVPDPFLDPAQSGQNTQSSRSRSDWIVEYVPDTLPGLVVRRNWLGLPDDLQGDGVMNNDFHVEQLLVSPPFSQVTIPGS